MKMTQAELNAIVEKHCLWLKGDKARQSKNRFRFRHRLFTKVDQLSD